MTESKHFLFDGVWIEIPIWTEYLARDSDGCIVAFSKEPEYDSIYGIYLPTKGGKLFYVSDGARPVCIKVE